MGNARHLTHVCLVTDDVPQLARFYASVLACPADIHGDQYAEVASAGAVLSCFRTSAMTQLAPGAGGRNGAMILEFHVDDVDAEYERLSALGVSIVKPPTTQPWGNRSVYFHDPDGNLVSFYQRVR